MACTLDELVSEDDAAQIRRAQERRSRRLALCAVACFLVAVAFAVAARLTGEKLYTIGTFAAIAGYLGFAYFARPRIRRTFVRILVFAAVFAAALAIAIVGLLA